MIKLPYCESIIIDTYSGVAGNVAALMVDAKNIPLIIANHFSIVYYDVLNAPGFNWAYYNDDYKIVEDMKGKVSNNNLITEIKKSIDEGLYVQLYIDHFYIKKSASYQKRHFLHDVATIFGYSDEEEVFVIGDNFCNGKYEIIEVSYDEVLLARAYDEDLPIERFKILDDYEYTMKIKDVKQLLESYAVGELYKNQGKVNKNNMHLLNAGRMVCGMKYYDVLIDKINSNSFDPRPFHIMLNHMQLYFFILKILNQYHIIYDEQSIREKVELLIEETTNLRNMYLKYTILPKNNIYNKMIEKIELIKNQEDKLLEYIIKLIDE